MAVRAVPSMLKPAGGGSSDVGDEAPGPRFDLLRPFREVPHQSTGRQCDRRIEEPAAPA